ncbi:MAG: hypothetical protein ABIJ09_18320 [Pseudomonadota bacterium]
MATSRPVPNAWTAAERKVLDRLTSPAAIQDFLDATPYSADPIYRCPRSVLRDRKAHCFDGALIAAAALQRLGHQPRLVDLRAFRDDDHVLAVFQKDGLWGAIAKSNFVGLRYREPIHRDLRELALSYVESYYNMEGVKSLREYSVPLDLRRHEALNWCFDDAAMDVLAERLDSIRHFKVFSPAQLRRLRPMDRRSFDAGMVGTDPAGVYDPRMPKH